MCSHVSCKRCLRKGVLHPSDTSQQIEMMLNASKSSIGEIIAEVADDHEAVARARLETLAQLPAPAYAATKADLRRGITDVDFEDFAKNGMGIWTSDEFRARAEKILGR